VDHSKTKAKNNRKNGCLTPEIENKLRETYYDINSPAGFSSIKKLSKHVGVSIQVVKEFLSRQEAYTLHKPIKRNFTRNRYFVPTFGYEYEGDLADFQNVSGENDGYKYVLCVIDVFSKLVQVEAIKDKTGKTVASALAKILTRMGPVTKFRSDRGREFYCKDVKKLLDKESITQIVTDNEETKCSVIERFIRTLKGKIYKYFTHFGRQRYLDNLHSIVDSYNNTVHSAIGMKPIDVNSNNSKKVYEYLYSGKGRYKKLKSFPKDIPKFQVGDKVKISKSKMHFAKGYLPNWTHEYFLITKVILRKPLVYKIKDSQNEEVTGVFYEHELQKIHVDDTTEFRIEHIIKSQGRGTSKRLLVKWKGYSEKFNSWINEKDLKNL
jgi:Integrase core domain/Chromo (CHRromatin Organisation MOdifier) domain